MNKGHALHGREFDQEEYHQVRPYLRVIAAYCRNPEDVETERFFALVEKTVPWRAANEEDLLRMSFYAWLKAKMSAGNLYAVTLELANF